MASDGKNTENQPIGLKGKRKKPVPKNANPLFTKWLTEWKDEAASKGWKSQYNYAKALKTLKLYPLCLESGKDCKLLQNFGDKTCKMLDEKLAEHRQNMEKDLPEDEDVDNSPSKISHLNTNGQITPHCPPTSNATTSGKKAVHAISDCSDIEKETSSPRKRKRSSGTRSREYIPAYRSGPYAIVLVLYRHSQDPDYKGYMTRTEVVHAAQPLADKSFTIPDPGSHYTAWSSMGTLIKRGLVSKYSSPARYSLTAEGFGLGERLENAELSESFQSNVARNSGCNSHQVNQQVSPCVSPLRHGTDERLTPGLYKTDNRMCSANLSEKINSSPATSYQSTKNVDNDVYVVSDDEDNESNFFSKDSFKDRARLQASRAHSLSPSSSAGSSPRPNVKQSFQFDVQFSNDALEEQANTNDISYCLMDNEENEDEVNITGVSQSAAPRSLRLPSLSPDRSPCPKSYTKSLHKTTQELLQPASNFVHTSSKKVGNDVIEIDDENDDDCLFEDSFHISQVISQKKKIFSHIQQQTSQSSQSDDDDLPDLDLDIPLSKRLFNKGTINSQLLSNCFPIDSEPKKSTKSSAVNENATHLSPKKSSETNTVKRINHVDLTEPCEGYTSIITKNISAGESSKSKTVLKTWTTVCDSAPSEITRQPDMQPPQPQFTLYPGTYEVVMCIDNREFYGSKSNSKTLLPDLMQNGVNCDLRLLHIGDILWIACEKGLPNEDTARAGRKELVLNFAVERKRLDDLVSSITGGRLKEQKFRLRHCGISELIILIEEYGSIQNFSISEDRIKQSIVNSQVLDGFKVKRCGGSRDAVTYLSMMTRSIQKYYGNKTLHAASHDYVSQSSTKATFRDSEYYLMPFDIFNQASIKHKALSVKEMFGKHLIQIPGVSLERACSITKIYPTPTALMKAYADCPSEKAKESLLATIKSGNKERNLGIAVSRMVYMLYRATQQLS